MTYLFFLGSHPSISVAEILAYFRRKNIKLENSKLVHASIFSFDVEKEIDAKQIISQLGGTVKIGQVVENLKGDVNKAADSVIRELTVLPVERYHFGFSAYGVYIGKALGLEVKKALIESGKKARYVVSREPILSSVIVETNKLLTHGFEFSFIKFEGKIMMAKTLVVQPFKELSKRDYGRPGRDDQSGMLPPKLAQIMLNLALIDENKNVLDPFCGSGTVLSEAALLGVRNLLGSDISEKAVEDTKLNLDWTVQKSNVRIEKKKVLKLSATELSREFAAGSIDAIACEPFLGPQRGEYDVRQVVGELETLYSKAILEINKVLKPGARAVMVWPVFKTKSDRIFMSAKIAGPMKMVKPLPENLKELKLTNRQTLLYGRPDQRVWRELVILEK